MPLTSRPVDAGFVLRADRPPPEPGPEILDRIRTVWLAEKARRPALFDGAFFSLARLQGDTASGFLAPYSWRLAQRALPGLRAALGLRPLDVSCLSLCGGRVVFGRRSHALAVDGGLWELCPSGTVHGGLRRPDASLDYAAHAAQEAREELGVGPTPDRPARPFVLVDNPETGVMDLGLALELPVSPDTLADMHRDHGDGEYEELALVAPGEALAFADALGSGRLAPVSRELLLAFAPRASVG